MSDTPPPQQGPPPPPSDGAAPRPARVLVVDASELGGLLQALLARNGLESVLTRTASAALDAILANAPELAIVDVDLPDASGVDLLHILHQPPSTIPVILMSNTPREALAPNTQRGVEQAEGFFQKPLHTRQLMDRVSQLLGISLAQRSYTPPPGVRLPQVEDVGALQAGMPSGTPADSSAYVPEITEELEEVNVLSEDVVIEEYDPPQDAAPARPSPPPMPEDASEMLTEDIPAPVDEPTRPRAVMPLPPPAAPEPPTALASPVEPALTPAGNADAPVAQEATQAEAPVGSAATAPPAEEAARPASLPPSGAATTSTLSLTGASSQDLLAAWRLKVAQHARGGSAPRPQAVPPATQGSLVTTPLHGLLDAFFAAQESGTITLSRGAARRRVQVNRGWVAGVQSNVLAEQLGSVLAAQGLLDRALLEDALRGVEGRHDRLGAALLADELLSREQLRALLEAQRARIMKACMGLRDGDYTLSFGPPRRSALERLFPGNVILRGASAGLTLLDLRGRVPAATHHAPRTDGLYPLSSLAITADEARLVIACDGTKSVEDLLTLSDLEEAHVLGFLLGLEALKLVRPVRVAARRSRAITYF